MRSRLLSAALALFGLPLITALSAPSVSEINFAPSANLHDSVPFLSKRDPPITWDNASLLINGKREMIISGEFHPFRLPVPALWHDVLEKIKAAGLNTVSFYINWALLEGKPGDFRADGIFALDGFFEAAREVGLWLIAKPGPYIDAHVSGGGLPGWIQRLKGHPRTADVDYLAATENYMAHIAPIIAKNEIGNGGKVILYQPESAYSLAQELRGFNFPDPGYMKYVEDQARKGGVTVPFINNDGWDAGTNAPGSGVGQVDIYGHNLYPLDWDCNDVLWDKGSLREALYWRHLNISPSTPFALSEFQGGMLDLWGSAGPARCAEKYNQEHSRVWYKNNYGAGVKIFNVYPVFGGTNWGNVGLDSGYTSYDSSAAIDEDRRLEREKYAELKLQANFLKVSPGYLTATPELKPTMGFYSPNQDITVTAMVGPDGGFYVTRKTAFRDRNPVSYTLTLPTSKGTLPIPKLGGTLTMPGRDTRIHVTDYPLGSQTLVYCTAEIFTWKKFDAKTVVFVYGGLDETHELLLKRNPVTVLATKTSSGVKTETDGVYLYAQWKTTTDRQMIRAGGLTIYMIDRAAAYNLWVPDTPGQPPLILSGGYLIRSATITDASTLSIRGDFARDTTLEIFGVPKSVTTLLINSQPSAFQTTTDGIWQTFVPYALLLVQVPSPSAFRWKYLDTLPELSPSYSDAAWPDADVAPTNNTFLQAQKTATSLYAGDYGFHAGGAVLFRGHFVATGRETAFNVVTQGGVAFASMAWLNGTFLGSWPGNATARVHRDSYTLPGPLKAGEEYVITVLVDNMGYAQNNYVGGDGMKAPRGILEYWFDVSGGEQPGVRWKVTGNFGGEEYVDKQRGPLNEGGLWAERQGYHQPFPPAESGK
ncbi:hypothetical protein VTI74DRAFT_1017 [Chaetomium olivicolor]